MRLGFVIYGDLAQRTGGYLYDRQLVAGLRRLGATVEVVGIPWRRSGARLLYNLSPILRQQATRGSWDAILQDALCYPSLWASNRWRGTAGPSRRKPVRVAIVHSSNAASPAERWLERQYLRSIDAVIANSAYTYREVEALTGWALPGVVAYPACGHLRPPVGEAVTGAEIVARAHAPVRLLFVGNLSPSKGLHLLLPALARLRQRPWRLRVVGSSERDESYARDCRVQSEALGLGQRIVFSGELLGPALRAAFRDSDLFVSASPREGFGLVFLEAMAFGLPVIASDQGAAPEIMTHGEEAWLVSPQNEGALAAALDRLISDRDLRSAMGNAALARVARFPHQRWDQTARVVWDFLRRL